MAAGASGGGSPAVEELGGASVTRYTLQNVPLYLAASGDRMVLSPNRASIERALGGEYARSISKDQVLGSSLAALDQSPTFLLAACPGRLARMARPFMPAEEYAQVEPVAQLLGETSVTLLSQHSDTRFALAARVENIPDVSVLVNRAVEEQRQVMRRSRDELEPVANTTWTAYGQDQARAAAASADDMESLRERFDQLVEEGKRGQAIGLTHRMVASVEDAKGLNNLAWALLTEERYEGRYDAAARVLSVRSNELTDHDNWAYVDTLALAEHRVGNHQRAAELQEHVLELVGDSAAKRPELREALERYRAAVDEQPDESGEAREGVVVR
jgi:tetratricopeptide (TPR) repeat protein